MTAKRRPHILIVDDEPINISMLMEILGDSYELFIATSGADCLALVGTHKTIDLILLDLVMPEMDGLEVAQALKSNPQSADIPFIFITAKHDVKSVVAGFEAGAVDYVTKPFAKEELLVRVQTHLNLYTLQTALSHSLQLVNQKVTELDHANAKLVENQNFLASILDHTTHAVIATDSEGTITLFNYAAETMLGFSAREVIGNYTPLLFHDEAQVLARMAIMQSEHDAHLENAFDLFKALAHYPKELFSEWTYHTKTGKKLAVHVAVSMQKNVAGDITGYIGIAEDITPSKRAQERMENYMQLIDQNVLSSSTDLDGVITDVSQAYCTLTGYTKEQLIGAKHSILRDPQVPKKTYKEMWDTITQNHVWKGTLRNRTKTGDIFWFEASVYPIYNFEGEKIGYTSIRRDVTDKKQVELLSITDALTGLYNRRHFNEIMPQELNRAKREGRNLGFMMLDVDHFKPYNDHYGHQEGDKVLEAIGALLLRLTKRAGDFAFRLGGEEFGVLFHEQNRTDAVMFAQTVLEGVQNLALTHEYNPPFGVVTVSIGLWFDAIQRDLDMDVLFKESDQALYDAKAAGRNRIVSVGVVA